MSRFYWTCDLVGRKYSPELREDVHVRIHDRRFIDRVVYTTSLTQVTYDESRMLSARVLDLFLLTQLESQS